MLMNSGDGQPGIVPKALGDPDPFLLGHCSSISSTSLSSWFKMQMDLQPSHLQEAVKERGTRQLPFKEVF